VVDCLATSATEAAALYSKRDACGGGKLPLPLHLSLVACRS